MIRLLLLLLCLLPSLPALPADVAPSGKRFMLYAEFLQDTPVELSDGSKWMMDKGDCFPVYMFKESRTKVVLQLASATFYTDSDKVKILPEKSSEFALTRYRKMVESFLRSQPEKWKQRTPGAEE